MNLFKGKTLRDTHSWQPYPTLEWQCIGAEHSLSNPIFDECDEEKACIAFARLFSISTIPDL